VKTIENCCQYSSIFWNFISSTMGKYATVFKSRWIFWVPDPISHKLNWQFIMIKPKRLVLPRLHQMLTFLILNLLGI
jgi:hypothetical protein